MLLTVVVKNENQFHKEYGTLAMKVPMVVHHQLVPHQHSHLHYQMYHVPLPIQSQNKQDLAPPSYWQSPPAPPRVVGSAIPQTPSPAWSPPQLGPFTDWATITSSTPAASSAAATDRATIRQSIPASLGSSTPATSAINLIIEMLPAYFEKSF